MTDIPDPAPQPETQAMGVRAAAVWSMAAQYGSFILQFVTTVIISRFFLEPDEVGLFSIALAAAMLLAILQDFGLTRYISGLEKVEEEHVRTCASIALLFSLVVGGLVVAAAWPMSWFYGEAELAPLLLVIAGSYLLVPFSIIPVALLTRRMDFRSLFVINVGTAFVQGAAAIALAAMGFSAFSLAIAMAVGALAKAVIAQWRRPSMPPFPLRLHGMRPIVHFGSITSSLYIIGSIGSRSADLVVGRLLGLAATGLFSRASALAVQVRALLSGAISGVFYPAFARRIERGESLEEPYRMVVAGYTAVTWPAMAGLAIGAVPLVNALYGPVWAGVGPVLFWIALSELLFIGLPLHMELHLLHGKMRRLLVLSLIDTAVSLGTLGVLAMWGLEWAAISRLAYGVIWFALYLPFVSQLTALPIRRIFAVQALSALASLAAILPLGIAALTMPDYATASLLTLGMLALAGVVCWFAALWALRHPAFAEIAALAKQAIAIARRPMERHA